MPRVLRNQTGSLAVEMVIVAVPFFLLVLGIIQLVLMQAAKLGTMRAADAAVRAAVVILDDDPKRYGGAARNRAGAGSARMRDIEMAAAIALVPFDPPVPRRFATVATALATPAPTEAMPGLMTPSPATLGKIQVTFPSGGGSFGLHSSVTVRVEFDFDCLIPLARRVVCVRGTRRLIAESTLTNQGAPYTY